MFRLFALLFSLVLATRAVAATIPITDGPLTVNQGDILVTSKPLVGSPVAGVITLTNGSGINRMDGKVFTLSGGATRLGILGDAIGGYKANAYRYQVIDGAVAMVAPLVAMPSAAVSITPGVNLAGCYAAAGGALCPSADEVDALYAKGFHLFRFAVKDNTPFTKLAPAIDRVLALGGIAIVDRHDYATHAPADNLAFWKAELGVYVGNPRVMIDLDNEPRGFNSAIVPNDFMEWAAGTRDTEELFLANGLTNPVLTEWPQNDAIYRFDKGEAATKECESAGCAIDRTPGFPVTGNVILSPHTYLDHGSSGTSANCDPYNWSASFATQARKRHLRAIIGEEAWGKFSGVPASCAAPGAANLAGIRANSDVYIGFNQWGFGREWPASYIFAANPKGQSLDNSYVDSLVNR